MNLHDIEELTKKVIASGIFKFKCNPEVTKVYETKRCKMVRIMWGINQIGEEMEYGGEGIEISIPKDITDEEMEETIIFLIDKDLGGIFKFDEGLYWNIVK